MLRTAIVTRMLLVRHSCPTANLQRAVQVPRRTCTVMSHTAPRVVVRWPGGQEHVVIDIVPNKFPRKGLNRDPQEAVHKALTRLQTSLAAKKNKKRKLQKKGSSVDEPEVTEPEQDGPVCQLLQSVSSDQPVNPETPNSEAWRPPAALCVGAEVIPIIYNPPTVTHLELPPRLMPGFPMFANVEVLYADAQSCQWEWLRLPPEPDVDGTVAANESVDSPAEVRLSCTEPLYTPVAEDVGCRLKVRCTPVAAGAEASSNNAAVSQGDTEEEISDPVGPQLDLASLGCFPELLPEASGTSFRVVTYNILADQYTAQEYAQKVIFAHVPEQYLDVHWRKQLVLRDLINCNADILCLQEVDTKVYKTYLLPLMERRGFSGWYANKAGKVSEGSVLFYRTSLFELVAKKRIDLPELFTPPLPPLLADFAPLLDASPHLTSALKSVTTIAQASLLVPRGRLASSNTPQDTPTVAVRPLVIANTHLFFHGDASHIRTMHVTAILREAAALADSHSAAAAAPQAALLPAATLFCGDLNSDINDGTPGTVQLLSTGAIAADYFDWSAGARFAFETGRDDEARAAAIKAASRPSSPKSTSKKATPFSILPHALAATAATAETQDVVMKDVGEESKPTDSPSKSRHTAPIPDITGIDITLPHAFKSSHALDLGVYTNYVPGYKGMLDYIWVQSEGMNVVKAQPIPPVDRLGGFLPNAWHGSDHLPVVADVELLDSDSSAIDREKESITAPGMNTMESGKQTDSTHAGTMHVQQTSAQRGKDEGCTPAGNMGDPCGGCRQSKRSQGGPDSLGESSSMHATSVVQCAHPGNATDMHLSSTCMQHVPVAAAVSSPGSARCKRSLFNTADSLPMFLGALSAKAFRGSPGAMQCCSVPMRCAFATVGTLSHMHALCAAAPVNRMRGSFRDGEEDAGDGGNTMHGADAKRAGDVLPATDEFVAEAAQCMRDGGVVALPTDTLYGFAALGTADEAIKRIYNVKGRDSKVPLAVCVARVDQVELCGTCQNLPAGLLHALLPGPVTVVLTRPSDAPLSRFLNPELTGMAIRVPAHGFIQQVVHAVGAPIVLTSANKSGDPSTTAVDQFSGLWDLVDVVFDGGEIVSDGKGSTIVDLQQSGEGVFRVLRDGSALEATSSTLARFGLKHVA